MNKPYGWIYKITNTINGKVYIGLTVEGFDKRYYGRGIIATHNRHLKYSIEKYGVDSFVVEKEWDIAYSEEELDELEKYWIYIYNARNPKFGYNIETGGHNGRPNLETRKKQSASRKKYYQENPVTNEQKIAISKRQKGKGNSFYGRKHSEEQKQKWSEQRKGKNKKRSYSIMKPVICITTGEIFICMKDACNKYNIDNGTLSALLNPNSKRKRKTCGKLPDGTRLEWKYYEGSENVE